MLGGRKHRTRDDDAGSYKNTPKMAVASFVIGRNILGRNFFSPCFAAA